MKPFNLERALAGDKVVTRDGREVTQFHRFECAQSDSLYAVCNGMVLQWMVDGNYFLGEECGLDLFMAPKTVKRWVNFYIEGGVVDFDTELLAKINGQHCSGAIAIAVPVEFEEGYGCEVQP